MSEISGCSHDKAYFAILITVIPLWAIITILIVFVLITFHRNLRATKIYDNCTKQNAECVYHVEIRTGDTSSTYNRRKTTITIDMFDENQNTLARVAIPGHVIFGRKEAPVETVEDDRFFELRVTRLWLYRPNRLRRVATIRITHSCLESEARIMIYGVELRSSDADQPKLFFPVMNYVTAYGGQNKPNACFDSEPLGSITGMGGQVEQSPVSEQLSFVDYSLLVLLFLSLVFHFSTYDFLEGSFKSSSQAAYKGAILGCCCFSITLIVGILMRYVIKYHYSQRIGTGLWAGTYYTFCTLVFMASLALWIYTTYSSYKNLCSNDFSNWLLTICVAVVESVALTLVCATAIWLLQTCSPIYAEQYVLPDDVALVPANAAPQSGSKTRGSRQHHSSSRQHQPPPHMVSAAGWQMQTSSPSPVPVQYVMGPQAPFQQARPIGAANYQQTPQYVLNPVVQQTVPGFKTFQTGPYPGGFDQHGAPFYNMPPQAHMATQSPQHMQSPPPGMPTSPINYHQQTNKGTKKVGSNESTGSTYYQQLMKNKGGVKSISQYGELMKQKKVTVKKQ